MRSRNEILLLLESRPYARNKYAGALNALGYWQIVYADYTEGSAFFGNASAYDAVVAVWTDPAIAPERFARMVACVTSLPRVRGALIVSPFTTEDNARLLARSGAKGWARPPVPLGELGARVACLLGGDRRTLSNRRIIGDRADSPDRRHQPLYPLPLPA